MLPLADISVCMWACQPVDAFGTGPYGNGHLASAFALVCWSGWVGLGTVQLCEDAKGVQTWGGQRKAQTKLVQGAQKLLKAGVPGHGGPEKPRSSEVQPH